MPLGPFERDVLLRIASNRHPDSFVGGATVLHQSIDSPRSSRDVDIFHDAVGALAAAVEADTAVLRTSGYEVELEPDRETFRRAIVQRGGRQTRLEWVLDSAFRFFPVESDPELGWRLNFWDAATNKALALAGRSELRDWLDASESALELIRRLPLDEVGCLYLDARSREPVCPNPAAPDFSTHIRHYGSVKGAWPRVV